MTSDDITSKLQRASGTTGEGLEFSPRKLDGPVWKGPEVDGITFSLLSRFLVCRERFRLLVVEGLKVNEGFNHRLEFGNMWHRCEETYAKSGKNKAPLKGRPEDVVWAKELTAYAKQLNSQYRMQQEDVLKWYEVCKLQFPLYVDYWSKHPDMMNRTSLLEEHSFTVPYKLPSGRIVRLRGKWDSVDLVKGEQGGIWLMENKTKGDVRPIQMQRQLKMDLQTMMYLTALSQAYYSPEFDKEPVIQMMRRKVKEVSKLPSDCVNIVGVRYNVIRRPLSGGKGTIVQHKPSKSNPAGETREHYYERLAQYIKDEPDHYFMRWNVEVSSEDVQNFRRKCLDPILESLCDWWGWLNETDPTNPWVNAGGRGTHWQHPFGVWNVLNEGGSSDVDEYLETGSTVGLQQVTNLFPELT